MSSHGHYNCPITVDQIELPLISKSASQYNGLVGHIFLFKWSVLRHGKPNAMFEKKKKKCGERGKYETRIILHVIQ